MMKIHMLSFRPRLTIKYSLYLLCKKKKFIHTTCKGKKMDFEYIQNMITFIYLPEVVCLQKSVVYFRKNDHFA